MNKFKTSFVTDAFFKAIIPLGIKSACSFISKLLLIFTSQSGESQDSDFIFFRHLDQLLSLAYSNYLVFLAMMLAIHLIGSLLKFASSHENSPISVNLKEKTCSQAVHASSQRIFVLLKLLLCYTLLFGCSQFLLSILPKSENRNLLFLRNLDQANENLEEERLILPASLNPGEILGSFSSGATRYVDDIFFVVSKDGKTLFSVIALRILTIFDISDPKNPLKKGEVTVNQFLSGSILLSPDEQIVYVHGQKYLYIFNVSSHVTPTLLDSKDLELNYIDACSMAISSDGQILFTANSQSLKMWDVSRPRYSTLLSTKANENGGPIVLSKDNTRLAIGKQSTFEIYNVAEPRNQPALICSQSVTGRVHSIAFSSDENRIFIGVNEGGSQTVHTLSIMIYGLNNFMAPSLLVSKLLSKDQLYGQLWFHANREFVFFNTHHEFKILRLSDLKENTLFSTTSHLSTLPFAASSDSKVNVLYFSGMINILKFNIDIAPPNPFVHFKPNALKVIDEIDYNRQSALALAPDEKNFFLVRTNKTYPYFGELIPYERKSCATFERLNPSSSFTAREFYISGESENTKWSLVSGKNIVVVNYQPISRDNSTIFVIDTTDKNRSRTIVTLQEISTRQFSTSALTMTNNEKNIIFINDANKDSRDLRLNIKTLNYQRLDSTLKDFQLPSQGCSSSISSIKVSKDDSLLFAASCELLIYNINNLQMPSLESSYKLDDIYQTLTFTLSKDEKTLYLLGLFSQSLKKLLILDISNKRSPQLLSSLNIERNSAAAGPNAIELSQDEKTLFLGYTDGLLMLDIRSPTQPKIFGFNHFLEEMYAPKLSSNGSIFYAVSALGVKAFDITSNYILYLKNSNFLIGDSYSITLNALKLNKNFSFDYIMNRHKFLQVSLFNSSNTESPYSALPSWITFNKERSFLKIEPNSASTKGAYKISVGLSTQVQSSSFLGLESVPSEIEAENLMLNLLQSGYIDNKGYLSGDLDLTQEQLRIDPKYKKIEKDIRMILLQNYAEAIGEISVSPSLNLSSDTKYLQISSLSQNTIYVAIQLDQNDQRHPYFLTKTYPYIKSTITNDRSVLLLEGTLGNINEALKEVLVDVGQLTSCSGRINITDGINPQISQSMDSISKYFKNNSDTIHISKRGYLEVSFLNKDTISVTIQLLRNSRDPYFLTKTYPFIKSTITNNRSLLLLEGSLENINEALKEILIDLDQLSYCNGLINATDNINPPISRYIDSISSYFINQTDTIYVSNKHLKVSSLNKGHLTVTIQLDQEHQAHFVNKPYSFIRVTITNNKTLMYLEGSMDYINEALETVLIDLGSFTSSGGLVTVSDGINPSTSKHIKSISDYFQKNEKPFYNPNLPIQSQINRRPFYTGLYSMVELNSTTFTDNNSLPLEFSLEMEDSSQEPPSWISLKGLSLMGTPPEKYSPLSYNFKLKVKNEFRETIVPFTLDIHISFTYGAKLVSTYVGYLVSFIGIVLSLNKIYNVLAKRYYRYPSSFKLRVGEKITDNQIFPIAFIKQEMAKSKGVFKALKKYIAQNHDHSSPIEYFVEYERQILDKEKIITTLDLLDNEYYNNASSFSRGVIQQLIINLIVQMQLSSGQEKMTKDIFNKVQDKWMNIVFPKSSSSSACPQFTISSERLEKELLKISPEIFEKEDLDDTHLSAELLVSTKNKVNMDLLKNAILAHAFSFQNLNINSILIDVISYKKLKGNSLWHSLKKFLLRDLKPFVVLNKREIGYGIEYNIDDDVLFFSGQLTHDLRDNIIVVHVKNNRGRILSEFWITGADEEVRENSIIEDISEKL